MLKLTLYKDKTTPGTLRFKEDTKDHPVTIYLTKSRVSDLGDPDTLEITITKGGDHEQQAAR